MHLTHYGDGVAHGYWERERCSLGNAVAGPARRAADWPPARGSRGGPWLLGAGCLQRPHVTAAGGAVICDGDLAGDVGVGYYFGGLAGDVGVAYYFGGLVVQSPAVFRIDHWRGCDPR